VKPKSIAIVQVAANRTLVDITRLLGVVIHIGQTSVRHTDCVLPVRALVREGYFVAEEYLLGELLGALSKIDEYRDAASRYSLCRSTAWGATRRVSVVMPIRTALTEGIAKC